MSPSATSVASAPPRWWADWGWPMRPGTPTDGAGSSGFTAVSSLGYHTGSSSLNSIDPQIHQASSTTGTGGVDFEQLHRLLGGRWCARCRSLSAVGTSAAYLWRMPWWTPALNNATGALEDDDAMRVGWLRAWLFTRAGGPGAPDADRVGLGFRADDGTPANAAGPIDVGGFGIYQRAGTQDWRWIVYSPALALLESIDLDAGDGWHCADFIIRQARRGNVLTPWLTLRWDGVDIITERLIGSALLPAPSAYLANAQSWALTGGARALTATPWEWTGAWRWRQGPFHPDGYPIP